MMHLFIFLTGTRSGVQMGTIIGWLKKLKPETAILMMLDSHHSYLICTFPPTLSFFFILFPHFVNHLSYIRTASETNCLVIAATTLDT
jgi:hypothetical protein